MIRSILKLLHDAIKHDIILTSLYIDMLALRNATVYDAAHEILAQLGHATLPQRLALPAASQVAVVSVWGGSSASSVSLEVETPAPESLRLQVPGLRSVPLQAGSGPCSKEVFEMLSPIIIHNLLSFSSRIHVT